GRTAMERDAETLLHTEQRVGQILVENGLTRTGAPGQWCFVGMADGGLLNRWMGEETLDDLAGGFAVETEYGLAGRVMEHGQDLVGITCQATSHCPQIDEDLRQAQQHSRQQCPQQHQSE